MLGALAGGVGGGGAGFELGLWLSGGCTVVTGGACALGSPVIIGTTTVLGAIGGATIGYFSASSNSSNSSGSSGDNGNRAKTGKSDRHGDQNAMSKAEKQLEKLRQELDKTTSRRERAKIEQKMKNIIEIAKKNAKGETHWMK
jgi:hypothetical protein